MRIKKCWFCSANIYPGHGLTFIRNDCKSFSFCGSKCHKNFKLKRNPRKVSWTKAHRRIHKKELPNDPIAQFAKRRSTPLKYDRLRVEKALETIDRVAAVREKRSEAYHLERTQSARLEAKMFKLNFIDSNLNLVAAPAVLKGANTPEERRKRVSEFLKKKRIEVALRKAERNAKREVGDDVKSEEENTKRNEMKRIIHDVIKD